MSWEAIKYVSSGFTLCAFIVAAVAWVIQQLNQSDRARIALAPEAERAKLVAKTLEGFDVDTDNLTKQQQYDIAMKQIGARIERFRIVAIVVVILAVLGCGGSLYAIAKAKEADAGKKTSSDAGKADTAGEVKGGPSDGGVSETSPKANGERAAKNNPTSSSDDPAGAPTRRFGHLGEENRPLSESASALDFSEGLIEAHLADYSDEDVIREAEEYVRQLNIFVIHANKDLSELEPKADLVRLTRDLYARNYWPEAQALSVIISSRLPDGTIRSLNRRMPRVPDTISDRYPENPNRINDVSKYLQALATALKVQTKKAT